MIAPLRIAEQPFGRYRQSGIGLILGRNAQEYHREEAHIQVCPAAPARLNKGASKIGGRAWRLLETGPDRIRWEKV